ncbi:nucleotidyltransferase family protein [Spirosoma foliorum]|uniref:Nucleotidyltransferase domain-containing protein n=1 Tax=Spirosoma foliorum TaxID=2710596 RepID=A0A7G5GV62_9BACT|nr:nucleotidyltransferase domain-containing protein [Spirosoma foliorum]QMW02754.1 nucleotidyltransferase domain-containing protein [Spirosoma foliorum]
MEATAVNQEFILETLRANRERLRTEFGIDRIGLYGSFARNEQTEKSDIDLVYELTSGFKLQYTEKDRLYRILRRKLHRKMDLVDSQLMNPIIRYYMRKDVIYV